MAHAMRASLFFVAFFRGGADAGYSSDTFCKDSVLLSSRTVLKRQVDSQAKRKNDHTAGNVGRMEALVEEQVIRALAAMKEEGASNGASPVPEDVVQFMGMVRQHMDDMKEHLPLQHKIDQTSINESLDAVSACNRSFVGGGELREHRRDHAECRFEQVRLRGHRNTRCKQHDDLKAALITLPCDLGQLPHQMSEEVADKKAVYEDCLNRSSNWASSVQELQGAWDECKQADSELSIQVQQCDANQTRFESEVCGIFSICACSNRSTQEYRGRVVDIKIAEAARQADFRSSVRIDCLFDVLLVGEADKDNASRTCDDLAIDVSHLQLDYGTVPEIDCTLPSGKPCDVSWTEMEYGGESWYSMAPTAACTPCEGPTTTTMTTTAHRVREVVGFVATGGDSRLHRCMHQGNDEWECGIVTRVNAPRAYEVILDANGDYIVGDSDLAGKIYHCPANGADCSVLRNSHVVTGLALAPNNDLLVSEQHSNRVMRCADFGRGECSVAAGGVQGSGGRELYFPRGIAVDTNGDYVIADDVNRRVQLCPASESGDCKTVAADIVTPWGVAVASNGDYIVSAAGENRILRCPASGSGECATWKSGFVQVGGIALAPNGDLWVAGRKSMSVHLCRNGAQECTSVARFGSRPQGIALILED